MKKYAFYKTVQLVLFAVMTAVVLARIFPDADLYHQVAADGATRLLAIVLWAALGISFLFILLDFTYFSGYLKDYKEMELAATSDPTTGIANRFSCDVLIEKYADKPLPDNLGCIMIDITNLYDINRLYGHVQGNVAIRDFSAILRLSSDSLCFVGKNGGNKFLALFEDSDEEKMQLFLDRIAQRTAVHNRESKNGPIEYASGSAFSNVDKVGEITRLISLANSRIPDYRTAKAAAPAGAAAVAAGNEAADETGEK